MNTPVHRRGSESVAVLSGGVGAARFLSGVMAVVDPSGVTAIVNVGDDTQLHGLMISPDLDTISYTLAGLVDPETGWGLVGETWSAMTALRRFAETNGISAHDEIGNDAAGWFALGDQDLGTHLYRTSRRLAGAPLSTVTSEIATTLGLGLRLLPVTDDELRTRLHALDGRDLSFQEYFVREHHDVSISEVRFAGSDTATPAPGVIESIETADVICIAPSNPVISIDPILAVDEVRRLMQSRRASTVAVSPIVGGHAIKGPAERLMVELGHESSVVGVARWYAPLASTLVIDSADEALADEVRAEGMRCLVTDTVMSEPRIAAELARTCIDEIVHTESP